MKSLLVPLLLGLASCIPRGVVNSSTFETLSEPNSLSFGKPKTKTAAITDLRVRLLGGGPEEGDGAVFPAGTTGIWCGFEAANIKQGSLITLTWLQDGVELSTSTFGDVAGQHSLSTHLESDAPLPAAGYNAVVKIDGAWAAQIAFYIEGEIETEQPGEPRVHDIVIRDDVCPETWQANGNGQTRLGQGTEAVHLCLEFDDMPDGSELEVRWFRNSSPREPLAVTAFNPAGSGALTAMYVPPEISVPNGGYHVAVQLGRQRLARVNFIVGQ